MLRIEPGLLGEKQVSLCAMQPLSLLEVLTGTACTHNVLSQGGQRLEQVSRLRRVDGRDEQDGRSS